MFPQGLVLLLTSVSLAVGSYRGPPGTLVQQLFCIETLSRVDVLCLDKTGTLTTGEMSVLKRCPCSVRLRLGGIAGGALCPVSPLLAMKNATAAALLALFCRPSCYTQALPFSSERRRRLLCRARRTLYLERAGLFCCRMPATRCTAPCSTIRATAAACCLLPKRRWIRIVCRRLSARSCRCAV